MSSCQGVTCSRPGCDGGCGRLTCDGGDCACAF
jgi:hypothetical protein